MLKEYSNAKLKRSSLKLFQIYTVQLRQLSTFLTFISVLKSVNICSCFGRAINDFGKLFSAPRPYKVTLEIKIFRFAPNINFNCRGFSILFHLTLNLVPRVFVPLDQRSKNERLWEHPFLNNRILPIRFHCAVSDFLQNGGQTPGGGGGGTRYI